MARRASIQGPNIGTLLGNVGGAIKRGSIKTLETASLKAKKIEEAEIRRATGGDLRMSGVGRSRGKPGNAKVGVRYDIDKSGEIPSAKIKAIGPLHLLERDTSPHYVTSAYTGTRSRRAGRLGGASSVYKRGSKKRPGVSNPSTVTAMSALGFSSGGSTSGAGDRRAVLNIPGIPGNFRRYATHPGTRGKHPWEKGKIKAYPVVRRIMRTNTFNIIRSAAKP